LPVKHLNNAKQRLADVLTPEERCSLAQAMLQDTFRAVCGVRLAERVFVVTNYEPAANAARVNGWEILREDNQISESASVDWASRICAEKGVTSLLRLPLDLPLVQAADIDSVFAGGSPPLSVVIVPSRDGTGTNAILRTPPVLFPSHFGPGSFAEHCAEARRIGATIIVRRNPRLEMDVDDGADLRALIHHDLTGTQTGRWLRTSGVGSRFKAVPKARASFAANS
jgi:2-phospho-L-lactate/phosphoenolpyruvate guanylyltransferase